MINKINTTNIHLLFYSIVLLIVTSCSSGEESENGPDGNNTGTQPAQENAKILDGYSSFTVTIPGSPRKLSEIAQTIYQTPDTPYGMSPSIDFRINADNTLDVLWLDNAGTKHLSRISLVTKTLVQEFVVPAKINSGRFLGFDSYQNGNAFIIGYSRSNAFGQQDAEAWYTGFDKSGKELFSTRIWGDANLDNTNSKGSPGQASSATIRYNKKTNTFALYLGHTMRAPDNIRHQGGWMGLLDENGKLQSVPGDWFYSHNFDQRCLVSAEGKFYTLAHGDAFPRALGLDKWQTKHEAGIEYYKIKNGTTGDNTTHTSTGDLTELANGDVAIAYTTKDERTQRDLRVTIVHGLAQGNPAVTNENWITNNTEEMVGWGAKILQYSDSRILVGWNSFAANTGKGSYVSLLNLKGEPVSQPEKLDDTYFYPSQSFQKTTDGKNIVFISGEPDALKVHVIKVP
jgi:hypothetical protein